MSNIVETFTPRDGLKLGDEVITKLEFRAPTGADIMSFPIGTPPTTEHYIAIAVKLTAQPPTVFMTASGRDVIDIALVVDRLLAAGAHPTGDA